MSKQQRGEIAAAIENQLRTKYSLDEKYSDDGIRPDRTPKERALDTRIELVDLNADGILEVIAQGSSDLDCAPTGNCPFWIFQKSRHCYNLLLDSFGQTFTVQKHMTNGYHDIVVGIHDSADESGLLEYRYNAGSYDEAGVYSADWTMEKDGVIVHLTEPRISGPSNP